MDPVEPQDALPPRHLRVPRTARYYVIGKPGELVRDLWIMCHGFAQLARDFASPLEPLADDTRLIVVPEALNRFYLDSHPMRTKVSRMGATWMTREDRDADIEDNVSYLDALYEHVLEELANEGAERDRMRVHALGFSQGVATVSRWAARGGAVVDHIVAWGHGFPADVNLRALAEHRPGIALDIVYGTRDRWLAPEAIAAQLAMLEASGVPHRVRTFNGGHTLSTAMLRELMAE